MKPFLNSFFVFATTLAVIHPASAETLTPVFDSQGRLTTAGNINKADITNLAVGPISGTDYFRTYLTFDLTAATQATGETSLTLFNIANENNTSSLPQVFTLYVLDVDWDGAAHPGPTAGTAVATVNITPANPNDGTSVTFFSTALTTAFNDAVGSNLHLVIRSDAEGTAARSFRWFGSTEDGANAPLLTYTPPDTTAPMIVPPTVPADDASGVLVTSTLTATFDEPISLENGGTITLDDLGAGPDTVITLPDARVNVVGGNNLVITPSAPLATGTSYAVQISSNAVKDLASPANFFAGISDTTTWNFQTAADGAAPVLVSTTPVNGATGVVPTINLVAEFDEPIVAGSGNIRIRNLSTGASDIVIPVGSPQVSIAVNTLTIDPATDLNTADNYAIRMDAGAIRDTTGNSFGGILDNATWNFTMAGGKVLSSFDARADSVNENPLDKTSPNDLGVGPISSGRFSRTYLTFDLTSASVATGETTLILSPAGVENNTSSVAQTFTLFVLDSDWDGAAQPGPEGAPVATISFTPQTGGDDNRGVRFTSAALTTAFNNALGGNLYLGIISDQEGPDARSFLWLASREEPDVAGFEPRLDYLIAPGGETFADWIAGKSGVGGQTAVGDDPDGDGIDNGVENFFGTEPGVFSEGVVVGTVNPGAGTFSFTHPQGTLASDLTATYRWSTDLVTFHDDGASSGGTTVNFSTNPNPVVPGTPTTVTATVTGTPVQKLFVRVEVVQN